VDFVGLVSRMNENPYTSSRVAKCIDTDGYRTILIGSNMDTQVLKMRDRLKKLHVMANCYHSILQWARLLCASHQPNAET